jgi:ADP-heptose:LPS heptosyltransferase
MRILVIRRGAIGDTIVTLPTIEILRENYPDAYIEVIGNREYWEIANNRYYVNAVLSGETMFTPELYSRGGRLSKEVVDYFSSFDLIIAYINDLEGVVSENLRKIAAKRVLTYPPFPRGDKLHAVDYTALVLGEIGLGVHPPLFPKIYLNSEDLYFASQYLSSFMEYQPLVAIHPRTYGIKRWAIEKFINIGKWIEDTLGGRSIWIIGPAEKENIKLIKSNFPSSPVLHLYSLAKVASVLSLSYIYLGCDTGISHLASAIGTRVIALFGPTNPQVWGPRGKLVEIIKADEMFEIREDDVKDAILRYDIIKDTKGHKIPHLFKT